MNEFKTDVQGIKDIYTIEYRTNSKANYEKAQNLLRKFVDNKPKTNFDKITESVESLAKTRIQKVVEYNDGGFTEFYGDFDKSKYERNYFNNLFVSAETAQKRALEAEIEWLNQEVTND